MSDLREAAKGPEAVTPEEGFLPNGEITKNCVSEISDQDISRIWGGDRRLSLFNYSIETITMLILPMLKTK